MEPITIGLIALGVGGGFLFRNRLSKAAVVAKNDAAALANNLKAAAGAAPSGTAAANTAAAAPVNAPLVASIQAGLANGTVQLGTNGVPFQAIPVGTIPTPAAVLAGLMDVTGTKSGILRGDLVTVNSSILADALVPGATSIPGFQANENVLMIVKSNGTEGPATFPGANSPGATGGTGPLKAISQEARLDLPTEIVVPLTAITGILGSDAVQLEQAEARLAAKR